MQRQWRCDLCWLGGLRCKERGHGVPPHKDSSNTGPGPASSSASGQEEQASTPQAGETSETSARDEFKQDRM